MQVFKIALAASLVALAAMTSACSTAGEKQPVSNGAAAKPRLTTDLYIEGGVDRTKMNESWKSVQEFDKGVMPRREVIGQGGQGYPDIRP